MNNIDQFLVGLPTVGTYFGKAYAFWRTHVAVANTTHVVLGASLAMVLFSRHKKIGFLFIVAAAIMHVVAFLS